MISTRKVNNLAKLQVRVCVIEKVAPTKTKRRSSLRERQQARRHNTREEYSINQVTRKSAASSEENLNFKQIIQRLNTKKRFLKWQEKFKLTY